MLIFLNSRRLVLQRKVAQQSHAKPNRPPIFANKGLAQIGGRLADSSVSWPNLALWC